MRDAPRCERASRATSPATLCKRYEWDTLGHGLGSNYSSCSSEVTCGFDTHYPEYFPVREAFASSLRAMQALGVRVAPYINGRIFDKATASWAADHAAAQTSAAKQAGHSIASHRIASYRIA